MYMHIHTCIVRIDLANQHLLIHIYIQLDIIAPSLQLPVSILPRSTAGDLDFLREALAKTGAMDLICGKLLEDGHHLAVTDVLWCHISGLAISEFSRSVPTLLHTMKQYQN